MNNQSNRRHRSEVYLLEQRNVHSGVEGEGCLGDRKKAYNTGLVAFCSLHGEIDTTLIKEKVKSNKRFS